MNDFIKELMPWVAPIITAFLGAGGNRWYQARQSTLGRNGDKERRSEPPQPIVTRRECELTHKGIESELKEGNRRMGSVEKLIGTLNATILKHFDK